MTIFHATNQLKHLRSDSIGGIIREETKLLLCETSVKSNFMNGDVGLLESQ